jgi:hypothetical protein
MAAHSVIVLRPRSRPKPGGFRGALREVVTEVMAFERSHAKVAWGATLVGFAIGVALRALG